MNTPSYIPTTIVELIALHAEAGGYWFSRGAMDFFASRIESDLIHGRFFITSEKKPGCRRRFSVRIFDDEFHIKAVGKPFIYATRQAAMAALHRAATVAKAA